MKPLRHLILLGFVCQGLASQNALWAVLFAILWALAVRVGRPQPLLTENAEAAVFLVAMLTAYRMARHGEFALFVALGYPLLLLQLNRLTGTLAPRLQLWCVVVALMHVAIGSQAIFDWRWAALLGTTVVLLPRTLRELAAEPFGGATRLPRMAEARSALVLAVLMIVLFLTLPRGAIKDKDASLGFVPPILDTTQGGRPSGDRVLFTVQGPDLSYLKVSTLDIFDGMTWSASQRSNVAARWLTVGDPGKGMHRLVRLRDVRAMERYVPTDRHVLAVKGGFLQKPYISLQGAVGAMQLPTDEPVYEYWADDEPDLRPLSDQDRIRATALTPQTEQLHRWLDALVGSQPDLLAQAQKIAAHLRENFTYTLGAPALEGLSPIDDFIFVQKEGHCERFASALAILLRMRGIPARVVFGFLPLERFQTGDVYRITEQQGHAWTEAWFAGRGWVALDSTPYADHPYGLPRPLYQRVYDWVHDTWYEKVVFFTPSDRSQLMQSILGALRDPLLYVGGHFIETLLLITLAVTASLAVIYRRQVLAALRQRIRPPSAAEQAHHFYARMLRELARHGLHRPAGQTPLEFLEQLRTQGFPALEEAELVTERFCATRYGGRPLSEAELHHLEQALDHIRHKQRHPATVATH